MLFNSLSFFAFFAIVYVLYRLLPYRGQNGLLLVAGYFFYGCWDVRFLYLIAFSTTIDFLIGLMLDRGSVPAIERIKSSLFLISAALFCLCINWRVIHVSFFPFSFSCDSYALWPQSLLGPSVLIATILAVLAGNLVYPFLIRFSQSVRRRLFIFLTVFVNLSFLGFFKYFNFFIDSATSTLTALGYHGELFHLNVLLPVGISFYTFQSLSYTIDIYRGVMRATDRLENFALFVSYFPPLVAGPIERAKHLLPQLLKPRTIELEQSLQGLFLILLGLFKKCAIADGIAPCVNAVYNCWHPVPASDIIFSTVLFAVQIYCDFSGYTDIARGVSKLLGIELILNFDLPYFSQNPSEFWRRWHISLSSWLRDYLYIPLGGNRGSTAKTYRNLMITMILGGLWHGAAWNYVLWGTYQGLLLCVHRPFAKAPKLSELAEIRLQPRARVPSSMAAIFRIMIFFVFCCYGWLLFRATSLHQIVLFTLTIFGLGPKIGRSSVLPHLASAAAIGIPVLFLLHLFEFRAKRPDFHVTWYRPVRGALYATLIVIVLIGLKNAAAQFIYFQF
ncbi:MAG TPA: MBOAT family O-acyltransferase [Tepidisphaeraceae bacterium]|jgi:D-alanyl-lipoteichoic acid acyltransferase DltB (MBOAT superfamily)